MCAFPLWGKKKMVDHIRAPRKICICYDVIKRKSYVFLCTIFGVKLNDERFKMMWGGGGAQRNISNELLSHCYSVLHQDPKSNTKE